MSELASDTNRLLKKKTGIEKTVSDSRSVVKKSTFEVLQMKKMKSKMNARALDVNSRQKSYIKMF
jgi:hypothetical protein